MQVEYFPRDGFGWHAGEYPPHGLFWLSWLHTFSLPEVSTIMSNAAFGERVKRQLPVEIGKGQMRSRQIPDSAAPRLR